MAALKLRSNLRSARAGVTGASAFSELVLTAESSGLQDSDLEMSIIGWSVDATKGQPRYSLSAETSLVLPSDANFNIERLLGGENETLTVFDASSKVALGGIAPLALAGTRETGASLLEAAGQGVQGKIEASHIVFWDSRFTNEQELISTILFSPDSVQIDAGSASASNLFYAGAGLIKVRSAVPEVEDFLSRHNLGYEDLSENVRDFLSGDARGLR